MKHGGPRKTLRKGSLGIFLPLVLFNCQYCQSLKDKPEEHLAALALTGTSEDPPNDIAAVLPDGCKDKPQKAFPAIFAHYLAQSFPEETKLEDILANDIGKLECAPGPYVFERDNEMDKLEKPWSLASVPNYFVLHLDNRKFSDESFYIASQNGLPIHCQYYKLQQNDNATLVLLPRAKMEPNQVYFLYLILHEGDSRQTWIQPLQVAEALAHN